MGPAVARQGPAWLARAEATAVATAAATEERSAMVVAMATATAATTVAAAVIRIQAAGRHYKQWRSTQRTPRGNSPKKSHTFGCQTRRESTAASWAVALEERAGLVVPMVRAVEARAVVVRAAAAKEAVATPSEEIGVRRARSPRRRRRPLRVATRAVVVAGAA